MMPFHPALMLSLSMFAPFTFSRPAGMVTRSQSGRLDKIEMNMQASKSKASDNVSMKSEPIWSEVDQWQDEKPIRFEELDKIQFPVKESRVKTPTMSLNHPTPEEQLSSHWWRQLQQPGVDIDEVEKGIHDPTSPHYFMNPNMAPTNDTSKSKKKADKDDRHLTNFEKQ